MDARSTQVDTNQPGIAGIVLHQQDVWLFAGIHRPVSGSRTTPNQ